MNIAIIGHGVVGGGVRELLCDERLGITVKRIHDLRPDGIPAPLYTERFADILADGEIDCVVEAVGGLHPAADYCFAALKAGKHVVTSNKEMISEAYEQLLACAAENRAALLFSASVGGGVPWLHNLRRAKRGDTLLSIYGIANGTTNYILDAMAHGRPFAEALSEAQRLGFAEANPSADLEGLDVQRKCAISASVAFDTAIRPEQIPVLGIGAIRTEDIEVFSARGLTAKLLMRAERTDGGPVAYVEPQLLDQDTLLSHTPTNHNCIVLCAEHAGQLCFYGQGAGRYPTAMNIVQDLLDIQAGYAQPVQVAPAPAIDNEKERHPYYVRTTAMLPDRLVADRAGRAVITHPVSVAGMHTLAAKILKEDKGVFIAGIPGY